MNKPFRLLSALGLFLVLGNPVAQASLPSNVPGQPAIPSLAPMLANVLPAVVSIQIKGVSQQQVQLPPELRRFFGNALPEGGERPFQGLGSGVIIDAEKGYILTNNHVIAGANSIKVQLNDGREFEAKLIGSDKQTDIALIQILKPAKLTAIQLADSDKLRIGDFTVAVGNPFGLGQTVTSGIISALGRSGLKIEGLENFIQTDAAINRGNSGGALVNLNGQLIGINTAILAPSGGNIGIGFAIPSNMARTLADQLIQFGEVKRGLLGIRGTELTADIANTFKLKTQRGAFVSQVSPGSGSAKAGIKPGDVIVSLNGQPLNSFSELRVKVATSAPGTKVQLGLIRDGKPLNVTVTLDDSNSESTNAGQLSPMLQGATLSNGKIKSGAPGISVDNVEKSSPAAQVGLHKDDVIIGINRVRTRTLNDMRKILANKPAIIALEVVRGNENIYLLLR